MSSDDGFENVDALDDFGDGDICGCGCSRGEHEPSGRCYYCLDCDGFTLDEEETLIATAHRDQLP